MPSYWPTQVSKQCRLCLARDADYMAAPDADDDRFMPYPVCRSCAGEDEKPEITLSKRYENVQLGHCVCTFVHDEDDPDDYCGIAAAVFVLEDGDWNYDCLCSEHMNTSWTPMDLSNYRSEHHV